MEHHKKGVQEAIDHAANLFKETIETFYENKGNVPSFGDHKLDSDVKKYVNGLQDWISGSIYASYEMDRYFGNEGVRVKETGIMTLLPKRVEAPYIVFGSEASVTGRGDMSTTSEA